MGIMTSPRVRRTIHLYKKGGLDALKERVHPGRTSRFTPEIAEDVRTLLSQDDRTWNTRTLSEYIKEKHGVTLQRSALNVQLHRLNMSWQRTRHVVAGQADPQEKQEFKEDLEVIKKGLAKGGSNSFF